MTPRRRNPDRVCDPFPPDSPHRTGQHCSCRSKTSRMFIQKSPCHHGAHVTVPQPHKNRTGRFPDIRLSLSKVLFRHPPSQLPTLNIRKLHRLYNTHLQPSCINRRRMHMQWPAFICFSSYEGYPLIIPCHDDLLSFLRWNMIWLVEIYSVWFNLFDESETQ